MKVYIDWSWVNAHSRDLRDFIVWSIKWRLQGGDDYSISNKGPSYVLISDDDKWRYQEWFHQEVQGKEGVLLGVEIDVSWREKEEDDFSVCWKMSMFWFFSHSQTKEKASVIFGWLDEMLEEGVLKDSLLKPYSEKPFDDGEPEIMEWGEDDSHRSGTTVQYKYGVLMDEKSAPGREAEPTVQVFPVRGGQFTIFQNIENNTRSYGALFVDIEAKLGDLFGSGREYALSIFCYSDSEASDQIANMQCVTAANVMDVRVENGFVVMKAILTCAWVDPADHPSVSEPLRITVQFGLRPKATWRWLRKHRTKNDIGRFYFALRFLLEDSGIRVLEGDVNHGIAVFGE